MNNFTFDKKEQQAVLWLALAYTILLIFWQLFGKEINAAIIVNHAIFFFAAMLVAIFLHEVGHKIAAEHLGYHARVTLFTKGIIGSIIVAFYTFARVPIITGNLLSLDADPRRRLHRRRKYDNPTQQGIIAVGGVMGSIIAILLFRALAELTGYNLFLTAQFGASLHAIFSLVPFELLAIIKLRYSKTLNEITPSDGLYLLRASFPAWLFVFSFTLFFSVLANSQITSIFLLATLLAAAAIGLYTYVIKD